jgi:hypothetical protein
MGEAVDNSYVLLLCMNDGYSGSAFCRMGETLVFVDFNIIIATSVFLEANYAIERKIPVIPCMMQESFIPRGGLGIIKADRKHITFFYEDKFDENFDELIGEIDAIEAGLGIGSGK